MSNRPLEIPDNCYDCKIGLTCKVLPRWAEERYFKQYQIKRHDGCPYNAFVELAHKLYGGERKEGE